MKINKKKTYNNNLLIKLKLAEIRTQNFYLNSKDLTDLTSKLKRALKVIYKYHINRKKIMFIGVSEKVNQSFKKLLNKSKHVFLPDSFWNYGILTNTVVSYSNLKKKPKLFKGYFFKLKNFKNINLVVILESSYQEVILNECYKKRLPVISFNNTSLKSKFNQNYSLSIKCTFSRKKNGNSFFYSLLLALLKKREIFIANEKKKIFSKKIIFITKIIFIEYKKLTNGNSTFKKKS